MGGKTSAKSKNTWIAKVYDRINLTVPKGRKSEIRAHAAARGESVNGFIGRAISAAMEQDRSAETPRKTEEGLRAAVSYSGGIIIIPPDTEKAVQAAAEVTGESVSEYLARAVSNTVRWDSVALKMGIHPITGKPLSSGDHGKESEGINGRTV